MGDLYTFSADVYRQGEIYGCCDVGDEFSALLVKTSETPSEKYEAIRESYKSLSLSLSLSLSSLVSWVTSVYERLSGFLACHCRSQQVIYTKPVQLTLSYFYAFMKH